MPWLFLALLVAVGIYSSYKDIKKGKIKNEEIAVMTTIFLICIIAYAFFEQNTKTIISHCLITGIFSLTIGFFFWYLRWWGAGDAKLFSLIAMIITPLSAPSIQEAVKIPTNIIINSAVPLAATLAMFLFYRITKKEIFDIIKKETTPKKISQYLLVVFSISWITKIILYNIGIQTNIILNIVMIIIISKIINQAFPEQTTHLLIFLSILNITINHESVIRTRYIIEFFVFTLAYLITLGLIGILSKKYIKIKDVQDLKEGDVLEEQINIKRKNHKNSENDFFKKNTRLTEQETTIIKQKHLNGTLRVNSILVKERLPFIPFLFAGSFLTATTQTDIISIITKAV
jgi:Flp pilus assembly protein protease CpaA